MKIKNYILHILEIGFDEYFIKVSINTNNNFEDCYTVNNDGVTTLSECNKRIKSNI